MDELKPDACDRHPSHSRKISSLPKISFSRQHMMISIGILVLLLLLLSMGSILKSLSEKNSAQRALQQPSSSQGDQNINDSRTIITRNKKSTYLSNPLSIGERSEQLATNEYGGSTFSAGSQDIISMQAPMQKIPESQQHIELPKNSLNDIPSNKNSLSAATAAHIKHGDPSLSVAPTTSTLSNVETHLKVSSNPLIVNEHQTFRDGNRKAVAKHKSYLNSAVKKAKVDIPNKNFTLQLSSASRPDRLNAWAKKQRLLGYHIYQTMRNGQPWYVLVSGSYVTLSEAKRAIALLPDEVRAQNPWVKHFSQVKKEEFNILAK